MVLVLSKIKETKNKTIRHHGASADGATKQIFEKIKLLWPIVKP